MRRWRPKTSKCQRCGALQVLARDDGYALVEVHAQSDMLARTQPDPVVLWHEEGAGAPRVQRVSRLDDFERAHGPYVGSVWNLHFAVCTAADQPLGLVVSERGRKLLEILEGPDKRKRG